MRRNTGQYWKIAAVLSLSLAVSSSPTIADVVTKEDVVPAVETWVRYVTADAQPGAVVDEVMPYVVDGVTAAYIVNLAPEGYCICGADDRLAPVTLYNKSGKFDADNPNYRFILEDIARRLKKIRSAALQKNRSRDQYREILSERRAYWADLKARRVPTAKKRIDSRSLPSKIELPLTTAWRQGSPYNDQCPNLTPGLDERTLVGCFATATAQIMNYWQWPPVGVGSGSTDYIFHFSDSWIAAPLVTDPNLPASWNDPERLEWISTGGGQLRMKGYWDDTLFERADNYDDSSGYQTALHTLWAGMTEGTTTCSVNFGSESYNWGLIANVDGDADPDEIDGEIAKICYHTGVALSMEYGVRSSGAVPTRVARELPAHFQYDDDASRDAISTNTIIENIAWYRPIQMYGAKDNNNAHSWVICGYNTSPDPDQFLMNMGWGGGSTDWYTIDEKYPIIQQQVSNIAPENVVLFVGGAPAGDGSPGEPYEDLDAAVSAAPNGATLIFKAGSTHTLSGSPAEIDKPLTLKGWDITIGTE